MYNPLKTSQSLDFDDFVERDPVGKSPKTYAVLSTRGRRNMESSVAALMRMQVLP